MKLIIDRDVMELSRVRQRELLPRLLARHANQTGQILKPAHAARDVGLEPSTAENYTRLALDKQIYALPVEKLWTTHRAAQDLGHSARVRDPAGEMRDRWADTLDRPRDE